MFERYSFEDPRDGSRRVEVGLGGYVAAGVAGSLYVLGKAGLAGFVSAILPHLFMSGVVVGATGVTSFTLSGIEQLVALLVAIPAILTVQSLMMVDTIRRTYQNRGWIVYASV